MNSKKLPAPRKLMRSVARAKMRRAGMRRINHFFSWHWREYAVMREQFEPGAPNYPTQARQSHE